MMRTSVLVVFIFTLALVELCVGETDPFINEENEGSGGNSGPSHAILSEQPANTNSTTITDEAYNVEEAEVEKGEEEGMMSVEGTTKKTLVEEEEEVEPVEVTTLMEVNKKTGGVQEEEEEEEATDEKVARVVNATAAEEAADEATEEAAEEDVKDEEHYDINPKLKLPFNTRDKKPLYSWRPKGKCSSCTAMARKVGICHC